MQSAQQAYLTRVVDIVERHAEDQSLLVRFHFAGQNLPHSFLQSTVFRFQQGKIGAPRLLAEFDGAGEKIAPLERKRPTLLAEQTTPGNILPICGVQGDLPDVMTFGPRPPRRLLDRNSPQRLPKVRPMPGFGLIPLLQNFDEDAFAELLDAAMVFSCLRGQRP